MNEAQAAMVKAVRLEMVVQEVQMGMMERIKNLTRYLDARAKHEALQKIVDLYDVKSPVS